MLPQVFNLGRKWRHRKKINYPAKLLAGSGKSVLYTPYTATNFFGAGKIIMIFTVHCYNWLPGERQH